MKDLYTENYKTLKKEIEEEIGEKTATLTNGAEKTGYSLAEN